MHQCIVTVGGSEGIDLSLRALVNPGDEVIVLDPGYVAYTPGVELAGGIPVKVNLRQEDQFKLTPELKVQFVLKTKVLLMDLRLIQQVVYDKR